MSVIKLMRHYIKTTLPRVNSRHLHSDVSMYSYIHNNMYYVYVWPTSALFFMHSITMRKICCA